MTGRSLMSNCQVTHVPSIQSRCAGFVQMHRRLCREKSRGMLERRQFSLETSTFNIRVRRCPKSLFTRVYVSDRASALLLYRVESLVPFDVLPLARQG